MATNFFTVQSIHRHVHPHIKCRNNDASSRCLICKINSFFEEYTFVHIHNQNKNLCTKVYIVTESTSDQKTSLDKGQFSDGCQPCGHWTSTSVSKSSPSEELMSTGVSTLGNSEASSSVLTGVKCSPLQFQEEGNTTNTEQETAGEQSPLSTAKNQEIGPKEAFNAGSKMEEEYPESLCSICKNRRPKIEWKRDFTYLDLQSATEGFAKKNFISEGGFGSVYRGEVAVKQHKNASFQGDKEFKAEVHVLSKVRHKNLVRLLGSCSEGSRRLLVYEYVCNGSLDQHLSSKNEIKSKEPLL